MEQTRQAGPVREWRPLAAGALLPGILPSPGNLIPVLSPRATLPLVLPTVDQAPDQQEDRQAQENEADNSCGSADRGESDPRRRLRDDERQLEVRVVAHAGSLAVRTRQRSIRLPNSTWLPHGYSLPNRGGAGWPPRSPRCAPLRWTPNNYIHRIADGLGVDLEPEMRGPRGCGELGEASRMSDSGVVCEKFARGAERAGR